MKTIATRRWGTVRIAEGSDEEKIAKDADKAAAGITSEPCSGGEEEKIAKDARDKANAMTPQPKISAAKAAGLLRQMATSIEMSKKPDPKLLIQDVKRFLTEIGG